CFTPQLSQIWISYSPWSLTPEFDPFETRNSTWTSRSPKSCLLSRSRSRPLGPLTRMVLPGLADSKRGLAASTPTLSASSQLPKGLRHESRSVKSIHPLSSADVAAEDAASRTIKENKKCLK